MFSPDSKYLVTLGGGPGWIMHYWAWERSQGPLAEIKCSLDPTVPVYRATFNPQDNTHLCVTGQNTLKMYRYSDGNFKQLAFQKIEGQNYLSQTWLAQDTIVCGTEAGNILVFTAGELTAEIAVPERVTLVTPLASGFVAGSASGAVLVYERAEAAHQFKVHKELELPAAAGSSQAVHHVAVSPSEERMVIATRKNQLYTVALTDVDVDILKVASLPRLACPFPLPPWLTPCAALGTTRRQRKEAA